MLFALVYSMRRLLQDLVDVRLRVRDPEAERFCSGTDFGSCAAR
jgi:hypothetical protein